MSTKLEKLWERREKCAGRLAEIDRLIAEEKANPTPRPGRRNERPVPVVDFESLGTFDERRLIRSVLGDVEFEVEPEARELIDAALDHLPARERFVVECRARGKKLREVAEIIGWRGIGRAREVEAKGHRMLRWGPRKRLLMDAIRAGEDMGG